MKEDRIVEEHLKGELPFSDLYRQASQGEQCPDQLAYKIIATAKVGPSNYITRLLGRHRIWVEATLLLAAVMVLLTTIYAPKDSPEPECPRPSIKN